MLSPRTMETSRRPHLDIPFFFSRSESRFLALHPDSSRVTGLPHDLFERHPAAMAAFIGEAEAQHLQSVFAGLGEGRECEVDLSAWSQPAIRSDVSVRIYRPPGSQHILGVVHVTGQDHSEQRRKAYDSDREVLMAARIQRVLLQDLQNVGVDGIELAGRTLPSRTVDGDFFVSIELGNVLDVVVGDVMGKGLAAAMIAAEGRARMLKVLMELFAVCGPGLLPDVAELVQGIHDRFARELISIERFVTFTYVRILPALDRLDFVECGCPPAILYRASDRECLFLKGDNAPVGFSADWVYTQHSVPFERDDLLLLYSDGLSDVSSDNGEQFGIPRIAHFIAGNAGIDPKETIDLLSNRIREFGPTFGFRDDVTFVLARRNRLGSRVHPNRRITSICRDTSEAAFRRFCLNGFESWAGDLDVRSNPRLDRFVAIIDLAWKIVRECYRSISDNGRHEQSGWSWFLAEVPDSDALSDVDTLGGDERSAPRTGAAGQGGRPSRVEVIISLYDAWSLVELRTPMIASSADGNAIIMSAQAWEPPGDACDQSEDTCLWVPDAIFCPNLHREAVFFVSG
ncbi:MAG: serine/threonine-protein phosphatase [Spirochaetaceae bacterium]|nr:MAG: serine/threonine-protein phosphatase [Spirochaetaceae bacterium]